jgi:phosphoribosyl 1,2-cyclic phosphodiesterase
VGWQLGNVHDVRHFVPGDRLSFGDVTVHTLRTPHDGVDTACFVVERDGRKLGIFTDLGHPFRGLESALAEVDAAYLESNYDPELLQSGPYPEVLKRRIAGKGGHLSNVEAARLVVRNARRCLQWLAVAHLSEENNTPSLAVETHRMEVGKLLPLHLASRYEVSDVLEVE